MVCNSHQKYLQTRDLMSLNLFLGLPRHEMPSKNHEFEGEMSLC